MDLSKIGENFKYLDISPEISQDIDVWPGDVSFRRAVATSFEAGDNLLLSSIESSLHIGAHADAPNHYSPDGQGIAERNLSYYIGDCQVIDVSNQGIKGERIQKEHIEKFPITTSRVIFKTNSFLNPNQWNSDFMALSKTAVEYLAAQGVRLIGIDTPSIDPQNCKTLEAHKEVFKNDMAILEGLILKDILPGGYFIIALPLKIKDADASPVRAILIEK